MCKALGTYRHPSLDEHEPECRIGQADGTGEQERPQRRMSSVDELPDDGCEGQQQGPKPRDDVQTNEKCPFHPLVRETGPRDSTSGNSPLSFLFLSAPGTKSGS